DEAILWLERARGVNPEHPSHHAYLAAAYALKGKGERAAAELVEARRLTSDGRYSSITRLKSIQFFGMPNVIELFESPSLPVCARPECRKSDGSGICRLTLLFSQIGLLHGLLTGLQTPALAGGETYTMLRSRVPPPLPPPPPVYAALHASR